MSVANCPKLIKGLFCGHRTCFPSKAKLWTYWPGSVELYFVTVRTLPGRTPSLLCLVISSMWESRGRRTVPLVLGHPTTPRWSAHPLPISSSFPLRQQHHCTSALLSGLETCGFPLTYSSGLLFLTCIFLHHHLHGDPCFFFPMSFHFATNTLTGLSFHFRIAVAFHMVCSNSFSWLSLIPGTFLSDVAFTPRLEFIHVFLVFEKYIYANCSIWNDWTMGTCYIVQGALLNILW